MFKISLVTLLVVGHFIRIDLSVKPFSMNHPITGGYSDRNDGMVTQEDTIFVSGMDPAISEEEICQHFGAIGLIKVHIQPSHNYILPNQTTIQLPNIRAFSNIIFRTTSALASPRSGCTRTKARARTRARLQ